MITVYLTETSDIPQNAVEKAVTLLTVWRGNIVSKYKNGSAVKNGAFAYLLLKKLSLDIFGEFDDSPFTYGECGKPYFTKSKLFFSLSHCKTVVAAAVSEYEIGIDVADRREISLNIANRICSHAELERLDRTEDKQSYLLRLWCEKESLSKLSGKGYTEGFKIYDTTISPADSFTEYEKYALAVSGKGAENVKAVNIDWRELI